MENSVKVRQLFISLTLGLGLTLALLWLLGGGTPSAHADSPHHVALDCTGVPAPCHTTIQEAVDAAAPGDEIRVAAGTYTDMNVRPRNDITTTGVVTQVVYISKTITIRGGYTTTNWTTSYPITQPTTLDAQGQGRVLYITGDPSASSWQAISPTIEGLHITGGNAYHGDNATFTAITINITAQVAIVDDPDNILGGAINVGDVITGTYTYDAMTPDSNPLPTVGDYWHSSAPYGITVNAGGFVFETDPSNVGFLVEIGNNHGVSARDNYLLRSYNNLPLSNGALVDHISWQLDDPTATALTSEALPTVPPILTDWESIFGLTLTGHDPGDPFGFDYFIRAHVTSAELATLTTADLSITKSPMAEGLRITGGVAGLGDTPSAYGAGGGVYVITATATISNNWVFSNTANFGGGLYLSYSDATLSGNTVISNTAGDGGGLYLSYSAATLSGNTVISNTAGDGGGLYLSYSAATLSGNTVTSNTAGYYGGGLFLDVSDAMLNGNTVIANTASYHGGGLALIYSAATLSGNTVSSNNGGGLYLDYSDATLSGNAVTSNTANYNGGGLALIYSAATLSGNTVSSNTASYDGGGLFLQYSDATLRGNTVTTNTASHYGGGLYLSLYSDATLRGNTVSDNTADYGGGLYLSLSGVTLINNVVADNQANSAGSGLYIQRSSPRLLHTTIARNTGGDGSGVYVTEWTPPWGTYCSTVALTNTILVSHTVGITVTGGNTVTVNSVLWYGTPVTVSQASTAIVTVQNQHQGDPAFAVDGYHLTSASAAIDRGVNAGVTTDIDGDTRPDGCLFDLGADELMTGVACERIYLPLIMRQYP